MGLNIPRCPDWVRLILALFENTIPFRNGSTRRKHKYRAVCPTHRSLNSDPSEIKAMARWPISHFRRNKAGYPGKSRPTSNLCLTTSRNSRGERLRRHFVTKRRKLPAAAVVHRANSPIRIRTRARFGIRYQVTVSQNHM